MRATHCRPPPPVIAALDAAISFYIDCRVKPDNDKGGNDRAASIARSEAIQCIHVSNNRLILSLRGAKRRGNPLYARHCEIFARKSWQSINQRSLPGLLRRFTPRNDGVAKYSVTARLRKKSWQSSDCTNIFWVASLRTQRHFFSRTQRQCIKKSHRKQTLYTFYIFYLCNIIIF